MVMEWLSTLNACWKMKPYQVICVSVTQPEPSLQPYSEFHAGKKEITLFHLSPKHLIIHNVLFSARQVICCEFNFCNQERINILQLNASKACVKVIISSYRSHKVKKRGFLTKPGGLNGNIKEHKLACNVFISDVGEKKGNPWFQTLFDALQCSTVAF